MMTSGNRPKLNGFIRQAPSPKDKLFKGIKPTVSSLTADIDMRHWCSDVEDQRDLNSCVGNACVGALELLQAKQGLPRVDLSRLFCYYNARLMRGDQGSDAGSVIRFAVGTLQTIGTCAEPLWPYDHNRVLIRPTWQAYRQAYGNKIGQYELISDSGAGRIDAIVAALEGLRPVVFGMDVTDRFTQGTSDVADFSGPIIGTHAMCIVGYRRAQKQFIVRNSWGTQWADAGYTYMPEQDLDQQDASDFWVISEAPRYVTSSP